MTVAGKEVSRGTIVVSNGIYVTFKPTSGAEFSGVVSGGSLSSLSGAGMPGDLAGFKTTKPASGGGGYSPGNNNNNNNEPTALTSINILGLPAQVPAGSLAAVTGITASTGTISEIKWYDNAGATEVTVGTAVTNEELKLGFTVTLPNTHTFGNAQTITVVPNLGASATATSSADGATIQVRLPYEVAATALKPIIDSISITGLPASVPVGAGTPDAVTGLAVTSAPALTWTTSVSGATIKWFKSDKTTEVGAGDLSDGATIFLSLSIPDAALPTDATFKAGFAAANVTVDNGTLDTVTIADPNVVLIKYTVGDVLFTAANIALANTVIGPTIGTGKNAVAPTLAGSVTGLTIDAAASGWKIGANTVNAGTPFTEDAAYVLTVVYKAGDGYKFATDTTYDSTTVGGVTGVATPTAKTLTIVYTFLKIVPTASVPGFTLAAAPNAGTEATAPTIAKKDGVAATAGGNNTVAWKQIDTDAAPAGGTNNDEFVEDKEVSLTVKLTADTSYTFTGGAYDAIAQVGDTEPTVTVSKVGSTYGDTLTIVWKCTPTLP